MARLYADGKIQERKTDAWGGWRRTARTEPGPPGNRGEGHSQRRSWQVWQEEPEEVLRDGV